MKLTMKSVVALALLSLSILVSGCAKQVAGPHGESGHDHGTLWGYEGDRHPGAWSELSAAYVLCGSGRAQSPIDLAAASATPEPIELDIHYRPTDGRIVDNGHTIMVELNDPGFIRVDGQDHALVQLHFHHPSEHQVRGQTHPLEVHLVHRAADGSLAVIGVFLSEGAEHAGLARILAGIGPAGQATLLDQPGIDPGTFLPTHGRGFVHYDGSLTTPPCTEGVKWFVFETPIEASTRQIEAFARRYPMNARPVQPIGDRRILRSR